jgi:hypothetical protein
MLLLLSDIREENCELYLGNILLQSRFLFGNFIAFVKELFVSAIVGFMVL